MSNVFYKELEIALKGVHDQLDANEMSAKNIALADKLRLYFAHGASEKAYNKLITDQLKSRSIGDQFHEAQKTTDICKNVISAATAADADARNTESKVSTAAVNVESAANALTDLLADVAKVLAVVSSKDAWGKIFNLVNLAYELTRTTAEEAEKTTLQSLDTTIEAAQSRAYLALSQAKILSGDMDNLMKLLDQKFKELQTKVNDDSTALAATVSKENLVDGTYKTAREEDKAMVFSEKFINQHTNYDLKYLPVAYPDKGEKFGISFNAFPEKNFVLENGEIKCTRVVKEYRIIFVEKDDSIAFDIHAAKASEFVYTISENLGQQYYKMDFITAEYCSYLQRDESEETECFNVAKDYKGKALHRGIPYVFFVHLVDVCIFQEHLEDTDGFLSMPSLDFTLKSQLPSTDQPKLDFYTNVPDQIGSGNISDAVRISFTIDKAKLYFQDIDLEDLVDFRVLLFKEDNVFANDFNHVLDEELAELFKLDEANRLAEENYLEAKLKYENAIATGIGDIQKLKGALVYTELVYDNKRSEYEMKQEEIDAIYAAKLSNFILDQDILDKIPEGYSMIAEKIDGNLLEELKGKIERAKAELETQLAEVKNQQKLGEKLSTQLISLQKANEHKGLEISKKYKEIQLIRNLLGAIESRTKGCFMEFLNLDDLEVSPDNLESLNAELNEEDVKEIKELVSAVVALKDLIQEEEKNMGDEKDKERQLTKELEEIEAQTTVQVENVKWGTYRLAVLEKELKDLDPKTAIEEENKEKIASELAEAMQDLQAKISLLKAGVRTPNSIKNLENEEEKIQNKIDDLDTKEKEAKAKEVGINEQIKKLSAEAEKLKGDPKKTKEYEKLDADISKLTVELKMAQTIAKNFSDEENSFQEKLEKVQVSLKAANDKLKQYTLELNELVKREGEVESDEKVFFIARNIDGNFVDNYGEPMVERQEYQALIYTVIKPRETEAIPIFIPGISTFSLADKFDPKMK